MNKYGGFDFKNRKKYLCKQDIIIKENFTKDEKDYLKKDIINTIVYHMPNYSKKQIELIKKYKKKLLFELLEKIFNYLDNIDKINLIQISIKKYLSNIESRLRGPGFTNKKICKNDEDFLFLIDINKQDPDYFYSYKDNNNSVWFFDLRSIYKLLTTKKTNPYSREEFPEKVLHDVRKLKKILNKRGKKLELEEYKFKNKKEKVDRKLTDLTVSINQSGYNFNCEWIKELSKSTCINLYKDLEDLWNYRTNMTIEQRKSIIPPSGILFSYPQGNLSRLEKEDVIDMIINEINKFELRQDEGIKKLGYMYLIICMSEYNLNCRQSNDWVIWTQ